VKRALVPIAVGITIALLPVPAGLSQGAWYYFALFAAVIAGVITEPIPPAAVGLCGVILASVSGLVRESPAQATAWALSGFSNSTVWLIFAAFMFTLGYTETGLGRRIALHLIRRMGASTLGLGYAITAADLVLAPFTASTTARSGGTIYPAIRTIPELYGSRPNDPSARKIGAYLLYTAAATTLITSSMFITALAPNALVVSIVSTTLNVNISWMDWFKGFAPVGIVLLCLVPYLLYKVYPPEITEAPEAPRWAAAELAVMGPISRREITLLALVTLALGLWIAGGALIDPAMAAILTVVLMVILRVVSWSQIIGNTQAWNVLIWFATLLTLASGLTETKFVEWLAQSVAPRISGFGLSLSIVALVGVFFFLHYLFASITAHAATLFPVFLGVATAIPGLSPKAGALLLGYSLGLMGILTPYGGAHLAIYYGSGYIKGRDFWRLGLLLGVVFFVVYIAIIVPWLRFLNV
jgi:L-tartrate/succinate antiporter